MDIKCPHCGTEYEVEKKDMYHYTTCEVCGKGFVIGATTSLLSSDGPTTKEARQSPSKMATSSASFGAPATRFRPFAGRIVNGSARSSVGSPKSKWRNPFVLASVSCICLMVGLVFTGAVTSKTEHASKEKSPENLSQVMAFEKSVTTASSEENKEEIVSHIANTTIAIEHVQDLPVQASNLLQNCGSNDGGVCDENEVDKTDVLVVNDKHINNDGVRANVIKGKNPLELLKFGDTRDLQRSSNQDGTIQYEIQDFLGIQRMILGYTKKNTLYSICLYSENDHSSSAESDVRVSKLMQLCDEWYDGIEWKVGLQEHDGRKFAIGRIKTGRKAKSPTDMVFSIVPTRTERNVVGLQVNLIDNRRRRLESDYLGFDVRRPLAISESQYSNAKQWLRQQLDSNGVGECQICREYDNGKRYAYSYSLERHMIDDQRDIYIGIEDGVLWTGGKMPIDEDYAERLINAKIIILNKEFEGIAGVIRDYRPLGPGASIDLPCPVCHGEKSRQKGMCRCWAKYRKQNNGFISISRKDFKDEFEYYKQWYKTGQMPLRFKTQTKTNQQTRSKSKPLHEEYNPTQKEKASMRSKKLKKQR